MQRSPLPAAHRYLRCSNANNWIHSRNIQDKVENYLHDQVCSGAMTLRAAQEAIVRDWYAIYLQITSN